MGLPTFVRIKPGAIDRVGIYARRRGHRRVAVVVSEGLPGEIVSRVEEGLKGEGAEWVERIEAGAASFEGASAVFASLPEGCEVVVGLGGGKALDVGKYVAFLAGKPYYAVPTSLSNDGFCSPQSSLTMGGKRRSLTAALPFAVVVDTRVCLGAPDCLWWSGVGDLVAKVTAVADWKLAYHCKGEAVDDLAALLSDATVFQFVARPVKDEEGIRLLATALMLNGIAMAICGSSRPASGAEHLISHALDEHSARPRLHGMQVGVATYLVSRLQGKGTDRIAEALERSGFWEGIRADPFVKREWIEAVREAPGVKADRFTVLSTRDCSGEVAAMIDEDPRLSGCFVG